MRIVERGIYWWPICDIPVARCVVSAVILPATLAQRPAKGGRECDARKMACSK